MTLCLRPAALRPAVARPVAPSSPDLTPGDSADAESRGDRLWNRLTGAAVILVVYAAAVIVTHFAFVAGR